MLERRPPARRQQRRHQHRSRHSVRQPQNPQAEAVAAADGRAGGISAQHKRYASAERPPPRTGRAPAHTSPRRTALSSEQRRSRRSQDGRPERSGARSKLLGHVHRRRLVETAPRWSMEAPLPSRRGVSGGASQRDRSYSVPTASVRSSDGGCKSSTRRVARSAPRSDVARRARQPFGGAAAAPQTRRQPQVRRGRRAGGRRSTVILCPEPRTAWR